MKYIQPKSRISRAQAIRAAATLVFHKYRDPDGAVKPMTYGQLEVCMNDLGIQAITPAEMSDIWRKGKFDLIT